MTTMIKEELSECSLPPTKTLHALLVEDNIIALHFIETIMAQAGLKFTSALDGECALALVKSNKFDLIITDIGLPGISGYQLAHAIREWEKDTDNNPLPIIGLTALTQYETKKENTESGINKMLSKPINLKTVQDLICQYSPSHQHVINNP